MGSLYGFEVKSELPLRRLNAAAGTRGELRIEPAREPLGVPGQEPVSTLVDEKGQCWYASYELEDGACLLDLPPSGSFLLEPDTGRIVVERDGDGDDDMLEHRIASSALCTLLAMRGDLVLHAAAVETGGRAVVFCGPTQRGKSSLARALGEAGNRLLGEDGVAIKLGEESATAFPGARGVRIRSRDDNGRRHTELLSDPGAGEPPPCPVATVVLLGPRGGALEIEPLEPARALAMVTPNLVHSGAHAAIGDAFGSLAGLLSLAPVFRVSLPDDLDALPEAAMDLLDKVAGRG